MITLVSYRRAVNRREIASARKKKERLSDKILSENNSQSYTLMLCDFFVILLDADVPRSLLLSSARLEQRQFRIRTISRFSRIYEILIAAILIRTVTFNNFEASWLTPNLRSLRYL